MTREVKVELNPDRRSASVTMLGDPPFISSMDTATVETALSSLGLVRSGMLPEIQAKWDDGQLTPGCQRNPLCSLEIEALTGDSLLHIRHPQFGWLHFIIPKGEAIKLGQRLVAQGTAPPTKAAGSA